METNIISNLKDDLISFITEIENKTIENHLIIDLSSNLKISIKDINLFLPIAKSYKKEKKSLIIVAPSIDFNKISDKMTVVPTLQEAHDIIEMEEIERDLGF